MVAPGRLADLKPGVRLLETATGVVWEIERVRRANSYSTPWVHLVGLGSDGGAASRRVEGAGSLISEPSDASPAWTVHAG